MTVRLSLTCQKSSQIDTSASQNSAVFLIPASRTIKLDISRANLLENELTLVLHEIYSKAKNLWKKSVLYIRILSQFLTKSLLLIFFHRYLIVCHLTNTGRQVDINSKTEYIFLNQKAWESTRGTVIRSCRFF
jgi:hypothetical protein